MQNTGEGGKRGKDGGERRCGMGMCDPEKCGDKRDEAKRRALKRRGMKRGLAAGEESSVEEVCEELSRRKSSLGLVSGKIQFRTLNG